MALAVAAPVASAQPGQGTVSGVVSNASGPVAGAEIQLIGQNNNRAHTFSGAGGAYSLEAWPDTYAVGFRPPPGSSAGFSALQGVTVSQGQTTIANGTLASGPTFGSLSGNASYPDHAPDAGVQVSAYPVLFEAGSSQGVQRDTDEAGNWDVGQLPAGFYAVGYTVYSGGSYQNLGFENVLLAPGEIRVLSKELVGPKPGGTIVGRVVGPEGWGIAGASVDAAGLTYPSATDAAGEFRIYLPGGGYWVTAAAGDEDVESGSAYVVASDGRVSHLTIELPAKPVPAGTPEGNQAQQLEWFNQQRARWGLPAGIVNVPVWSRACAAHNAYQDRNGVLDHPEYPEMPQYSAGGNWAGTHSVLAGGGSWGPENNPWNDAPIHLNQMMAPALSVVGLDVSHGYSCLTTWPGMKRELPPGAVYTYPGDGTTGLPPAEYAAERPTTPNRELGIPDLAGRQLFVYEGGAGNFAGNVAFRSASLSSPSGLVPIKTMDGGGFLAGGIIVPVQPLQPFTRYTATVSLEPLSDPIEFSADPGIPAVNYSWSFTTGKNNPNGYWDESGGSSSRGKKKATHRRPTLKLRRRGDHMVVLGVYFVPRRTVVLRRQPKGRLIARTTPNRRGKFQVPLEWGHTPVLIVTAKQGKKTTRVSMRASGKHHR